MEPISKRLFPSLCYILFFAATLSIGLWSAGLFDTYELIFYVRERPAPGFTQQEVEGLIGKDVIVQRLGKEPERRKIVGYSDGLVQVCCITIERMENVTTSYGKSAFQDWVRVIE